MLTDSQRDALRARLSRGRPSETGPGAIQRRAADLVRLPMSAGQEQLWFLDRFAPGLPISNIPLAFGLSGPLDLIALDGALSALAARHEPLRTRLAIGTGGQLFQVIDPPAAVPAEFADLSGLAEPERHQQLRALLDAEAHLPFDLAAGPLLRVRLVRLSGREHVLVAVVHHAVFDGWSAGVFLRDLAALYQAEITGRPHSLPELGIQFADYALWERERLAGPDLAALEAYWRQVLHGFPTVPFPASPPRPRTDDFKGGLVTRTASPGLLEGLRDLSRGQGTTLYVILLAGLLAVLHRYTGADDLVVGTVSAHRGRSELHPLIGFLVNTLPIRADLSGDPSFTELADRVRLATLGAYSHQDVPFARIVETLDVPHLPGRAPVFQIMFSYADRPATPVAGADVSFVHTDLVAGVRAAKLDLSVLAESRPAGLWLECCYKTALFDHGPMTALLEHLEILLRGAVTCPGDRLSSLVGQIPAGPARIGPAEGTSQEDGRGAQMATESQRDALRARLKQANSSGAMAPIVRRGGGVVVPLSAGQEQLWFLDRFAPGLAVYNVPVVVGVRGVLDVGALERAVAGVVARHESLRTRFVAGEGEDPVQVIDPPGAVAVRVADWSGLGAGEAGAALPGLVAGVAGEVFDLAAGPLLRVVLVRLSGREHVLVAVVHHAVFDGWSAGVFVRDLAALYGAEVSGGPDGLPELGIQFGDYALWERGRLAGPGLAGLEAYWAQVLAGFPVVPFPASRPRPRTDDFAGALVSRTAGAGLAEGLRGLSRAEGTTVYVVLLAGLLAVLHRYTGAEDLVVGTVSARRGRRELDPLIGFLVNTLPIRADLSGDPSFAGLVDRVRQATLGAYSHQDLPFARLVEVLEVERDPGRSPVFQILFTYTDRADAAAHRGAGVEFSELPLVPSFHPAKFDLDFHVEAGPGGLRFDCCYKTVLFDQGPMAALLGHLEILLAGAVARPGRRLSELPMLTGAELAREVTGWNDTAAAFQAGCVHEAFQAVAAAAPGAVAAEMEGREWTYAELNARANRVARCLAAAGLGPGTLAGVCLPAGLDRLAVLLAVFKAGGGYVPLDPGLPPARLDFMIADTGMALIVTDDGTAASLPPGCRAAVIRLDREDPRIAGLDGADLDRAGVGPGSPAYVLYTSGSTGRPKGVVVEHASVTGFLHGMISQQQLGPADVTLQFASLGFDVSVLDTFAPLLSGGRVVLAPAAVLHSPPALAALMRARRVTFACLPPAVAGLLAAETFPALRVLMTAGEELPAETARAWIRPGLRLVNGYGPTEATVIATSMTVTTADQIPPIGLPQPNCTAYILDARLNPVPAGATGELHLGGAGIARGYLNRPDLTRDKFIPDPFTPRGRLYKTGDLARRRPDGAIIFAGRTDTQIKINGQRIEPGEIETTLTAVPGIAQALVIPVTTPAGDTQLAAYLRPEPGTTPPGPAALRARLAAALPAAMIPAHYLTLDAFPLNPSGKIDKTRLPVPAPPPGPRTPPAPATPLETLLTAYYATVLHLDHVSPDHNFFDIGGNSLAAMRLITTLRTRLDADLNVTAIFLHPTPRQLARQLRDEHGFEDEDADADSELTEITSVIEHDPTAVAGS